MREFVIARPIDRPLARLMLHVVSAVRARTGWTAQRVAVAATVPTVVLSGACGALLRLSWLSVIAIGALGAGGINFPGYTRGLEFLSTGDPPPVDGLVRVWAIVTVRPPLLVGMLAALAVDAGAVREVVVGPSIVVLAALTFTALTGVYALTSGGSVPRRRRRARAPRLAFGGAT